VDETTARLGSVALVGAGPGHPGLLTLRGAECLARAEVILYDELVALPLLDHAPAEARRICVRELESDHAARGPAIARALVDYARQGLRVVRLKGGDPFLFGRGGEEVEALRAAGVPFEVVPGVTAALGAAACAAIPLTHRRLSSAVALITGHECGDGGDGLDWQALARFPGTLAIYMGVSRLAAIVDSLLSNGKDPATPAAVVQWATTNQQRSLIAPLAELPQVVRAAGLKSPAMVLIGSVVSLAPQLSWFEQRPLFGRRVLVTRPRAQAGDFVKMLEEQGAIPVILPALEVREPDDWGPVDRALTNLASYQWLVFTSVNGVHALVRRLRQIGRDLRALGSVKLAAIGPATAAALRGYHLEPDLVPQRYQSEYLAEELSRQVAGQRVLLARADRGRELLREELGKIATVDQIAVYAQVDAVEPDAETLELLRGGKIDFATLTSSNIPRALVRALDDEALAPLRDGRTRLVTISPVTSEAVRELGLPVAAEAVEATKDGVLAAVIRLAVSENREKL
jgi:uroporphyrinogen III methyltransferase/synthase